MSREKTGFCAASFSMELLAEGVVHDDEEHRAAAQRAVVVGQDLAGPSGIEDVLPALGFVGRLHQVAVDHQAVADDLGRDADVVGVVGRHDVLDVRDRAVRLEVAVARHQPGGRAAVVMDIAQEPAGRLLDAHALADLAGARFQQLDLDAVLLLEGLDDRLVEGRADRRGVDDELAFLPGRLDHLGPIVALRRGAAGQRGARRQHAKNISPQHRPILPLAPFRAC